MSWDEVKKQRFMEMIQKAVPEAELLWWDEKVLAMKGSTGAVSLLLAHREWAPGLTTQMYHLDKFADEPVRHASRFSGQGWQVRLAKTAWAALQQERI